MRIGVISDTHGLLRPEVFGKFDGVDHIIHAGDIGPYSIITELETIAPVTAITGNTDDFEIRSRVPEIATLDLEGRKIVVAHGHQVGSPTPAKLRKAHPTANIIIYGHTHTPLEHTADDVLVLNPGAAGPARFNLPVTVAILTLTTTNTQVDFITLK